MKTKLRIVQLFFVIVFLAPLKFFAQLPKNATNQNKLPVTEKPPVKKDST